uniref:Uncharacterized protein n=1 Tax=Nelumbo nucifera TaxID=4432 RepID=A0A822ZS13_NELNU|nr:TPA_asm: hypothetical protein HUJ06_004435 [Nelumbo nucifera]
MPSFSAPGPDPKNSSPTHAKSQVKKGRVGPPNLQRQCWGSFSSQDF